MSKDTSAKKLTLDKINAAREKRKKMQEMEDAQFKVDETEVMKETNEMSIIRPKFTNKNPMHLKVSILAERMGMELKTISDNGDHVYKYGSYVLYMNADQKTMKFNEVISVGNSFNHLVHELKLENYSRIRKDMEYLLFSKESKELKEMIAKDREAWNSLYKKDLGEW